MDLADVILGLVEIAIFPTVTFALGWRIVKIRDGRNSGHFLGSLGELRRSKRT